MSINLIPPRLKKQKGIDYISNQIIFGLIVILFMLGILSLALFTYDSSIKADISKSESRLAEQDKRLKEFKDTENLIKTANQKLAKIDELLKEKTIWSEAIAKISKVTPKSVEIKTMDLNHDSSKVNISGIATTRKDIALFKEGLEKSSFKNVTFTSSSYNQSTNDYTFSLTLELEGK
jgi:Tfp pilus assembly protein PilN